MSMSVKERLEKSEALKESAETQGEKRIEDCLKLMIANTHCDSQCNLYMFNWHGGDCCPDWIGDGVRNDPCNYSRFKFDGGDCAE